MKPVNHSRKPSPTPITTYCLAALNGRGLAHACAARRQAAKARTMPITASVRMISQ